MPRSVDILTLVSVDLDGLKGIFAMDSSSGKAYRVDLQEAAPEESNKIFNAVYGQMRKEMPQIPHDYISDVMKAKKGVMDDNRNSFKRSRS